MCFDFFSHDSLITTHLLADVQLWNVVHHGHTGVGDFLALARQAIAPAREEDGVRGRAEIAHEIGTFKDITPFVDTELEGGRKGGRRK